MTPMTSPHSAPQLSEKTVKQVIPVEEFKEFPGDSGIDPDLASNLDETMSIMTDLSDEDTCYVNIENEEELFPSADVAEEACLVDDVIENDRYYKSLMAKQVNVLSAELEDINVLVNVFNRNVKIIGQASDEVYITSRVTGTPNCSSDLNSKHVTFCVSAPVDTKISEVTLNVSNIDLNLQDEILAHLGAFVADDQQTPNKVRLRLIVENSKIAIHDPKKKKPLRLSIKQCVIEQDEDDDE